MTLHEETIGHRAVLRRGGVRRARLRRQLMRAGYDGPWGIEVLNKAQRSWALDDLTARAFSTTRSMFRG